MDVFPSQDWSDRPQKEGVSAEEFDRFQIASKENEPQLSEEDQRFVSLLVESAYRPVFDAENKDRWEALQTVLMGPFYDALAQAPAPPPGQEQPRAKSSRELENLALIVSRWASEEDSELLEEGAQYLRRRNQLLQRRNNELPGVYAAMSHTASHGFFWAVSLFFVRRFSSPDALGLDKPNAEDFARFVLRRGGVEQYTLLRAAEHALLDAEEDAEAIEEGEMSSEAEAMEAEAHRAWLDVRQQIASTK